MTIYNGLILLSMITIVFSVQDNPLATTPPPSETTATSGVSSVQNEAGNYPSVTLTDSTDQGCTPKHCYGLRYEDIWRFYGGLFISEADILSRELMWMEQYNPQQIWWSSTASSTSRLKRQAQNRCCHPYLRHKIETRMINAVGESRDMLHLTHLTPPRYQWVPEVTCLRATNSLCRAENTTINLLVYSKHLWPWPFEFDAFQVPASCTCTFY